jgi:LAO/AO transport system kinase
MSKPKTKKPEWVPEEAGRGFTTSVVDGVKEHHDGLEAKTSTTQTVSHRIAPRRKRLTVEDYVKGVLERNLTLIARTITLVESNAAAHVDMAQAVLKELLPYTGESMRVGITGVPGAGKSTFIECLGNKLCDHGHRVAVLAIDPSSRLTGGSILGDKTRMETLSRRKEAFIRPSPTGGTLGGVTRKSRETLLVCEAAGFDVILVETVGVGQSEVAVRAMVDFFLLVLIAGAGDELQGMKRGVMELADAVAINKADGDNRIKALAAQAELQRILHYLQPATPGWMTEAHACSARTGDGVPEIWAMIEEFRRQTETTGVFEKRRRSQTMEWVHTMAREYLERTFFENPSVKIALPDVERSVLSGELSPTRAVQTLIDRFEGKS